MKGTAKQKEWAEKIRVNFIEQLTFDEAIRLVELDALCGKAKFWIENRTKTINELKDFIRDQQVFVEAYKAASSENNAELVKKYAELYNNLTAKWGY